MTQKRQYIWQLPSWPKFSRQDADLLQPLGNCRFHQGFLLSQMKELGFDDRQEARVEVLVEEALRTAEIEGLQLDSRAVRSSVARRLGLRTAGMTAIRDQSADGVVEILLDATQGYDNELTIDRLFGWHAALFPTGYSGLHKIELPPGVMIKVVRCGLFPDRSGVRESIIRPFQRCAWKPRWTDFYTGGGKVGRMRMDSCGPGWPICGL
jgi:hypothetical protein